jgi:hypothetical protein
MTNGLVSKVSPVPLRTKSNRTNDVGSAENGGPVGLTLKVTYEGGRKRASFVLQEARCPGVDRRAEK